MSQQPALPQKDLIDLQRRVYLASRDVGQPIDHLMPWLLEDANLFAAWDRVRHAEGAHTPGIDGVTGVDVDGRCANWLASIRKQLMEGSYKFEAPRWVEVPKKSEDPRAGIRRLGILTLRDRVVHTAIKQVLEPILEATFSDRSFGFRPGRSVPMAVTAACAFASKVCVALSSRAWVIRMDVADCFDTIDHDHLLGQVRERVSDVQMLDLIKNLLSVIPLQGSRWRFPRRRQRGVVQGSPLSALLCNIAFNSLDHVMTTPEDASTAKTALFRYADDMLLVAADRRSARKGVRRLRRLIRVQGQRLKRCKQHAVPLSEGVEWLGLRISPRHRLNELFGRTEFGYTVPERQLTRMIERIDELTTPPSSRIDIDVFDSSLWIVSINTQLRQWAQAYRLADDSSEVFRIIDEYARRQTALLLRRITGLSLRDLHRMHRARLPRGFWTWQVNGTRLVQLAALAPHQLDCRRKRPPWQTASAAPHRSHGSSPCPPAIESAS